MMTKAPERGCRKMKEDGLGKTFKVIGHKNIPTQHLAVFPLEKYSQNLPVNGSHGHAADRAARESSNRCAGSSLGRSDVGG